MSTPNLTFDASQIRAILLDIEGTTTPIEFVTGVLFPFARAHLWKFLQTHSSDADVRSDIEALRREHARDMRTSAEFAEPLPLWPDEPVRRAESAGNYALWLMDQDRKSTPLKSLQGKIWQEGYRSGELRGKVYPDVPPALERWRQQGKRIAIFSSGSVQAQQLLFRHSTAGDLTPYFCDFFDTTTGPKQDPQSYVQIAAALGVAPHETLFLSDSVPELDVAHAALMYTILCVRPSAQPREHSHHAVIHTFDEVP